MSRLGPWQPSTIEERIDRMESLAAIRQLPHRYGLALDSRDLDAMIDLFAPDIRVGANETGRPALRRWFDKLMRELQTSIHFVGNHVVNFVDADNANGIVYCRDELERPNAGWDIGVLQYWDTYRRVDGEWCFVRRKFHRWYIGDALVRPAHGMGVDSTTNRLTTYQLPEAFATWASFYASAPLE